MHPNPAEAEEESSLDVRQLREWLSYAGTALRRNAFAAIVIALLLAAFLFSIGRLIPERYQVEVRVLPQQADLIANLSNPGRQNPGADAAAERSVIGDLVLRRDNLLSIVRQTGLVAHWRATRPALLKTKDYLVFGRQLNDQELTDVLVWTLEKRITGVAANGVISITATWGDPTMAYRLADAAYRNFVRSQNESEMAMLGDSISLLEERLVDSQRGLDEALSAAKALPGYGKGLGTGSVTLPASSGPRPESADRLQLRLDIESRQRAIEELGTFRERRIAELQAQLAEQRAVYSESHPVVANLKRSLEALSVEPPQLADLKKQLSALQGRYVTAGGTMADLVTGGATAPRGSTSASLLAALGTPARGPAEEYARSRLTASIVRYYNIADRLEAARTERDAARLGDRFRYLMVRPPLLPRKPANGLIKDGISALGIVAAPFLALLIALGLELRKGRITQRWQVERTLGLPIIAELPARIR